MPPRSDTIRAHDVLGETASAYREAPLCEILARRGLGAYRGYAELLDAALALEARGATFTLTGRSVRGLPLFAVHLGAREPTAKTRTTVILAGVHPIEWIGVEACFALLDRLASTELGERSIIAFPIVNPDGFRQVEENLRAGRRRLVRHNARGVDLNRNFDAYWSRRGLVQRALRFLIRPGRHPGSEPEVESIAHALAPRRVDRAVSLHSFGGAVLYPSAATLWPIADATEHRAWARRIARSASEVPYRALPCALFTMGMTQSGLDLDWFHERHGAVSLLVECSRGGFSLRPRRLFEPFAWYNPPNIEGVTRPLAEALFDFTRGAPVA